MFVFISFEQSGQDCECETDYLSNQRQFLSMKLAKRLNRTQKRMSDAGAGLMILSTGSNLMYMTGVDVDPNDRELLFIIPSRGDPRLVVPEIESEKFEDANYDVSFYSSEDEFGDILGGILGEIGVPDGHIILDNKMWEEVSQEIRGKMPERDYGLAGEVLKHVRMLKSDDEIRKIKKASKICDRVVHDIRDMNPVGKTEKELANFINKGLQEYGAEGTSFETIVAVGENGAKPHHQPTDKKIEAGEMVVLDFGCFVDGYASDQTRTLVFGEEHPSRKAHEVHDIVRTAQEEAVQSVKPGIKAGHIDGVARSIIEEAGYGDNFIHRTGHGIGLDIHENPEIRKGNDEMLRPGMVFSVEPGIYLEDEFGVRIEDLVLVTENGCERLNRTSRGY